MAKIVVTGSRGFIGSHIVKALVAEKLEVCGTYNFLPPPSVHTSNLSYSHVDVTDFNQCLKLINKENPEVLFHLVAQPTVTAASRHPFPTMELTVRGSYNILEAVRQSDANIKAIIVVSSDKVYGSNIDAMEEDQLDGIDHPYNVAKICEDMISQVYAKTYGLPVVIARSANIYGGGDLHWDRLIPGCMRDVIMGNQIIIRSTGKQLRDYIYVDDIANAYMMLMKYAMSRHLVNGEPFNFGAKVAHTANEIVDRILAFRTDPIAAPQVLGVDKGEIDRQHINYDKAKSVLGWSPRVGIDDGLKRTFIWYKEWFSE